METDPVLVTSQIAFINLLMQGNCPSSVTTIFFGGRLLALQKKLGYIRPIAIGYSIRRLAAKCVNKSALNVLKDAFTPSQFGVDVSGDCEATVNASRRFLKNMPETFVTIQTYFSMSSTASDKIHFYQHLQTPYLRSTELRRQLMMLLIVAWFPSSASF
jgi:hypothetical protein